MSDSASPTDSPTDLRDPDGIRVSGFWARMRARGAVPTDASLPTTVVFGDTAALADELLGLILDGPKRATAGSYDEYVREGVSIPQPGSYSIAVDGRGVPQAVLRTTDVRVGPLSSVDEAFAWDEGEGDRTRASWLSDHHVFFRRHLPTIGLAFSPDMDTVFERFELVAIEHPTTDAGSGPPD